MNCRQTARGAKEFYEANEENYQVAKEKEFQSFVASQIEALVEDYLSGIEDEEIPQMYEFIDFAVDFRNTKDFSFPEKGDWLGDEYESALGDCADRAYDEARDREMEENS